MIDAYTRWVLRHPVWVIVLCLLLTAVIGTGLTRVRVTTDYRVYFSKDNPQLAALEQIERQFSRNETVLFVLAPKDGNVFTPSTLRAVRELTEATTNELPYTHRAYSIDNIHESFVNGDEIGARPLLPTTDFTLLSADELRTLRHRLLNNPRVAKGLLGGDGDVTGVVAYVDMPHKNPATETAEVAKASQALAAKFMRQYPQIDIQLTGVIMLDQSIAESITWDATHLFPLAFGLSFIALLLFYGGWRAGIKPMLLTMLVASMSVSVGLGVAGWSGIYLTTGSLSAPLIVLTLAIADCVHLLISFAQEHQNASNRMSALERSLRQILPPVFLTSLTTAAGFLGLNSSDSTPFRDLGNLVAIGVAAAFVFSVSLLPAALVLIRPSPKDRRDVLPELMEALATIVIRHQKPLLVGMTALVVSLSACVFLNRFGDNYVKFFSEDIPFRQATEFANDKLTGMQLLEYGINAQEPGGIYEPRYLQHLEAFVNFLKQQPEIVKVNSLIDLVKELNQTMHANDPTWYRIPDSRELAAQYVLFYELSLPAGADINFLANMDKSATRVNMQLDTISSEQMIALDARIQQWMHSNLPDVMQAPGSGIPMLFAHIARRNFDSMIYGNTFAFLFIMGILMLALRSVRLGALSLVPNATPALMAFGVWGLMRGEVGMGLTVVVSLTLGLLDDDTVHMMMAYRRARHELQLTPPDALKHAFRHAGTAAFITGLALAAGFCMLSFSSFTMTSELGIVTTLVIALALLTDFLLLPPLLLLLDAKRQARATLT